jgi:hypothetical protein
MASLSWQPGFGMCDMQSPKGDEALGSQGDQPYSDGVFFCDADHFRSTDK